MDLFGAAQEWGDKKASLPKICHTYPTMIKLDILLDSLINLIPYLKMIKKIYKPRDTPLEFC